VRQKRSSGGGGGQGDGQMGMIKRTRITSWSVNGRQKKSDLKKNCERRRQTNAENRSRIDDEKTDVKRDTKTYTEGRKDE